MQKIFLTKTDVLNMAYSMHSEFTLNNHKESIKTDTQMHTNKLPYIRPNCHHSTQFLKPQILFKYLDFCVTVYFVFRQWGLKHIYKSISYLKVCFTLDLHNKKCGNIHDHITLRQPLIFQLIDI